jgi:hypothetical protein
MAPSNLNTKFIGMYRGQVFDNMDPLKQGRIKVQVWPMMSEIVNADLLPWAVPAMPLWGGAGSGFGMMAIPAIGTHVFVFFEAGDVYQPVYFAEAQNAMAGIPAEVAGDYPYTRVMKSPSGVKIMVNDANGSIKIATPLNSTIEIDGTGNVKLTSVAGVSIQAVVDIALLATGAIIITATGAVNITTLGNITVNAVNAAINASGTAKILSIGKTTISATNDVEVAASGTAKVMGQNVVIVGSLGVDIN